MKRWVEIVLCRHTQTVLNAQGRLSGASEDVPLNRAGRDQANELANKIIGLHPKVVFCADLLCARQTAMFVSSACRIKIKADPRLREVDGESRLQVETRLMAFLRDLLNEYGAPVGDPKKTVAVVGHGTSLETMLTVLEVDPPVLHEQGDYQVVVYSA